MGALRSLPPLEKVCVGNMLSWRLYHLQYWRSNKTLLLLVDHLVIRSWRYGLLFNFYFSVGKKQGMRSQRCFINQEFMFSCLTLFNFVFTLYKIGSERSITYMCVCVCMHASVLSRFSPVWLFATTWTTEPARLLCPWDSPGKTTEVGCHALLRGIFLTQGSNTCLYVSCIGRQILYH